MSQIQSDKLYVLKGKTLKELKDRKVIGKLGEIAVDTDKKGNSIVRFASPTRCLLVDSAELRYGWIQIRWEE